MTKLNEGQKIDIKWASGKNVFSVTVEKIWDCGPSGRLVRLRDDSGDYRDVPEACVKVVDRCQGE